MRFRVVNRSSFAYETDLPIGTRNSHPSGVLHAVRCTVSDVGKSCREEQTFAWIANSIHAESAILRLEMIGYDRSQGILFIPYSTKQNWVDRYPHAALELECTDDGTVLVELEHDQGIGSAAVGAGVEKNGMHDDDISEKVYLSNSLKLKADTNIFPGHTLLSDADRDELHIEIFNYFSWLHAKYLDQIEKSATKNASAQVPNAIVDNEETDPGVYERKKKYAIKNIKDKKGVVVAELQCVLDKMELAFTILPEAAEEEKESSLPRKGAPLLEEALVEPLHQLVVARQFAGKPKRRSRKKLRSTVDFDETFQRLVQYHEEYGDCVVPFKWKKDPKLAQFVSSLRCKKAELQKRGMDFYEVPPGKKTTSKALTAERVERLNSIGFVWTIQPKTSWEDRFRDLIEYYEANDRWPSHTYGQLGGWVHRQRTFHKENDASFMKNKAPKLDEIGFEWVPLRGRKPATR